MIAHKKNSLTKIMLFLHKMVSKTADVISTVRKENDKNGLALFERQENIEMKAFCDILAWYDRNYINELFLASSQLN